MAQSPATTPQQSSSRLWTDLLSILRLGAGHWWRPQIASVDRFYSMCPEEVAAFLGGRLLNFGYWADDVNDQQAAARTLVHKVAQLAHLQRSDKVLDVGCGFGEAAMIFYNEYQVDKIIGVNVTEHHLNYARARAQEARVQDRVEFQFGDATSLPFGDASFDHVVALESAFHFDSREAFLHEAARVLKPNGRLTLADVVPLQPRKGWLKKYVASQLWLVPLANRYGPDGYKRKLEQAGLAHVRIQSIGDKVYPGYVDWTLAPAQLTKLRQQLGRNKAMLYRWQTQLLGSLFRKGQLDYLLLSSVKSSITPNDENS